MKTKSFKDLIVWQKSYQLFLEIYKTVKDFPQNEIYALSQQMKKSAISVSSNITEGYGRFYNKEYKQFLSIACGSLCELETQYLISLDSGFTQINNKVEDFIKEVGSMLFCMINPKRSTLNAKP